MSLSVKPKDEKPKEEKLNIVAKLEKDQKPLIANNWLEVPCEDDIKNSFNSGVTITWENGVKIRTNKKGRRYRWDVPIECVFSLFPSWAALLTGPRIPSIVMML